jgi:hypothetical protein
MPVSGSCPCGNQPRKRSEPFQSDEFESKKLDTLLFNGVDVDEPIGYILSDIQGSADEGTLSLPAMGAAMPAGSGEFPAAAPAFSDELLKVMDLDYGERHHRKGVSRPLTHLQ